MKNHLKIHTVCGFAVAAFLLAQLGCSSKSAENAVTAQPSPTPDTTMAMTSASPTPEATPAEQTSPATAASKTAARPKSVASNTGARSRGVDSNAGYNPSSTPATPAPPAREDSAPPRREYA